MTPAELDAAISEAETEVGLSGRDIDAATDDILRVLTAVRVLRTRLTPESLAQRAQTFTELGQEFVDAMTRHVHSRLIAAEFALEMERQVLA